MRYQCTLLAVTDMARSLDFYDSVLGQKAAVDYGDNVTLSCGIALQTMDTWKALLGAGQVALRSRAGEIYFEEDDMDMFLQKLESMEIDYVHPVKTQDWGQRCVRLYDPDGHIVEVGENMATVAKRFHDAGMTAAEIAGRMGIAERYVHMYLNQLS